ncbi:GMC oxidoreductase-domain-containing protein, partial [Phaeosphaeriaceae sp. PMI808]
MFSRGSLAVVATAILGVSTSLPNEINATDTYDYVIVGGGITGLVVANRLTEKKENSVLVIESGAAYDNPTIRLPFGAASPLNETLLWRNYTSDPEPNLGNRTWNTRVAQILGGGSCVNGMLYDRGSAADYNAWEELGNKGWGWDGMYPFFKKGTEFIPPPEQTVKEFNITWDPKAYSK